MWGNIHGLAGVFPTEVYLVLAGALTLRVYICILEGMARKVLVIILRLLVAVFGAFVASFV